MSESESRDKSGERPPDPHHPPRIELPANPFKGPLIFGVVMATIQMGIVLYFMYC